MDIGQVSGSGHSTTQIFNVSFENLGMIAFVQ